MFNIKIWFDESFKNIYKSPLITFLIISFFTIFFLFISFLSNVFRPSAQTLVLKNNEAYLNYKQYFISLKDEKLKEGIYQYTVPSWETEEKKYELANEFEMLLEELSALQSDDFIMIKALNRCFHFFGVPDELHEITSVSKTVSVLTATEDFFKYETLPIMEGRNLTEEDFDFQYIATNENRLLTIPVLAGYEFRKYYKIGDRIMINSSLTRTNLYKTIDFDNNYPDHFLDQEWCAVYEIKGFLEEGTTFSNPSGTIISTDKTLLAALKPVTREFYPDLGINILNGRISEIVTYKFYISKNKIDEILLKMNELLNKTPFSDFYEIRPSFDASAVAILDEIIKTRNNTFIAIAVAISFFAVIGISIATINKFKGNIKDYGIHRLLGATGFDISAAGALEMIIQLIIADILIHIPYLLRFLDVPLLNFINRNIPYMWNGQMYIMLLIANLVFIAVTIICNMYCIRKYPLIEIIRGNE